MTDAELREAAERILESTLGKGRSTPYACERAVPILRALVEREREACAVLVSEACPACLPGHTHVKDIDRRDGSAVECECSAIAAAIRARGAK